MKVTVWIEVGSDDEKIVESLYKSLKPDNRGFPPGIRFTEQLKSNKLVYSVEADEKSLKSLRNTIDDLLESLETVERVLLGEED